MATINGTFNSLIAGTLSGTVATPGATGPAGPAGPAGPQGDPGVGVPSGGLEGQVLLKASDTSYDTAWFDNYAATVQATVRNETGATLSKGTVVYISGGAGNKPLVTKASASTESSSSKTFAILAEDIDTNQNGQAVTMGLLKGLDTTAFTAGANLWLSTTAGEIVSPTPPATPAHAVFLGNVVRVHANQGEIEVRIQNGLELGELHDVLLDTPANGQVLKYDAAQGLWINGTDSSGVAWGGITGTLSSQTDLQSALDGKASLDFATFTGKVNFTPVDGVAGLNIGVGGTSAASVTPGDLYINTGTPSLIRYRDANSVLQSVPIIGGTNTFTAPQIINVQSSTLAALRVTQTGVGEAIRVEDSTSPDSTAFVVNQFGKVGIGVAPDASAALKVDTNGIMFGDGTTQTTAATGSSYSENKAVADMITASIVSVLNDGAMTITCDTRTDGSSRFPAFLSGINWGMDVYVSGQSVTWDSYGSFYFSETSDPWVIYYKGVAASVPFANFGS